MEKPDSSKTTINYMGLNEVKRIALFFMIFFVCNIASYLMFCFSKFKGTFFLKLYITCKNLIEYTFT